MRKTATALGFGLTLGLAAQAQGATVTVDFENVAAGIYAAGTDFSGLSFDQDVQIDSFSFLVGPATTGNIARQYKKTGQFTSETGGSINGMFANTVSSLTLGAGDVCCDVDNIVLTGFDTLGNVVASDIYSGAASGFLTIAGAGIASFSLAITDVNSTGSSGFDNFTFDVERIATVPVPASLPLLAAVLGGLGFVTRRRG